MTASSAGSRRESGAMTLSYVIIVPVFMAAIMVIAQAAVYYLARSAALAAARQGADAARVHPARLGAGPREAVAFIRSAAPGYLLSPRASARGSTPVTVRITVTGRVPTIVPGMNLEVSQAAQAPVERFTTP